jgi:hypothetical protein
MHDFLQLAPGSLDAFDSSGGFRGFDAGRLSQCLKGVRRLLAKEILFAAVGAQGLYRGDVRLFKS